MAKNTWQYANADTTIVGTMKCTCCRLYIDAGWFRYRETKGGYLSQHRQCSEDDKTWATYDSMKEAQIKSDKLLLEESIKFRDKWGISELDELIYVLENSLNNH